MDHPREISARRLEQLKSMAEAKVSASQASVLECAVPELVAQITSLREHNEKLFWKTDAAIEDLNNISAQVRGEDDVVTTMTARARQRLRGELGPGATEEHTSLQAAIDRLQAEKRVGLELINAEGLTGEYVHRLDAEGLVEHTVHDPAPATPEQEEHSEAVLHLYPLADEHGDAMVSGNHEGLRILKERLERALQTTAQGGYYIDHGYRENRDEQIFAADGEGYNVTVECRPAGVHDKSWEARPEPYFVSRRFARESGLL